MSYLDHPHVFYVLETRVYRHVQIMGVLDLALLQLFVELFVFLAFLDDIGVGVGRVLQSLLEEGHRDQINNQ